MQPQLISQNKAAFFVFSFIERQNFNFIKADEKNDYPYFFAVYERIRGSVHYVEDEFNEI